MFFETIKLYDGHLHNLSYHQERMDRTRNFHFPQEDTVSLKPALMSEVLRYPKGLYKVRVDYDVRVSGISIAPYEIKNHKRLKLVETGAYDYAFKFSDRSFFAAHLHQYPAFDDILFIQNGILTDTTYCNVALFDGNQWVTPATFLLPGTKRKQLLADKKIIERNIAVQDLSSYQGICFINAMRDFEKTYSFVLHQDEILLTENDPL